MGDEGDGDSEEARLWRPSLEENKAHHHPQSQRQEAAPQGLAGWDLCFISICSRLFRFLAWFVAIGSVYIINASFLECPFLVFQDFVELGFEGLWFLWECVALGFIYHYLFAFLLFSYLICLYCSCLLDGCFFSRMPISFFSRFCTNGVSGFIIMMCMLLKGLCVVPESCITVLVYVCRPLLFCFLVDLCLWLLLVWLVHLFGMPVCCSQRFWGGMGFADLWLWYA